jgi:hypothetical protein
MAVKEKCGVTAGYTYDDDDIFLLPKEELCLGCLTSNYPNITR